MGQGGLAVPWSAGFGDAADGDIEAERAGLADVVGDLPADLGVALVDRLVVLAEQVGDLVGVRPVGQRGTE